MKAGGLGIGGLLVLLLLSWATGVDFLSLVGSGGGRTDRLGRDVGDASTTTPEEEKLVDFVDAVMGDTQATWRQLLGNRYQPTKVRLVPRCHPVGVWVCGIGERSVLLPRRSLRLSRPRLLR